MTDAQPSPEPPAAEPATPQPGPVYPIPPAEANPPSAYPPPTGQPVAPGYPSQPAAYPVQPSAPASAAYPGQAAAYPAQATAYPAQPAAYPAQPGAYPVQPAAYPVQPTASPTAPAGAYPTPPPAAYPPPQGSPYAIQGSPTPPAAPAPKKKGGMAVIALAAVLILAAALAGVIYMNKNSGDPNTRSPEAVVSAYLEALAAGDAELALSLAAATPSDTTFLTDDFLRQAQAGAPMTGIRVTSSGKDGGLGYAKATWNAGGQVVTSRFNVVLQDKRWLLERAAAEVIVADSATAGSGYAYSLNGVGVQDKTRVWLFPGHYDLTLDHPVVDLVNAGLDITAPTVVSQAFNDLRFSVKPEGQQILRDAAQAFLDACVAEKKLMPSDENCGFGYSHTEDGSGVSEFIWTVTSSDLADAQFDFDDEYWLDTVASISVTLHGEGISAAGAALAGDQTLGWVWIDPTDYPDLWVMFEEA